MLFFIYGRGFGLLSNMILVLCFVPLENSIPHLSENLFVLPARALCMEEV